ncbi:potassium voltage-gated channel subfamily H member 8-like [Dreissena polymorpha]|uniref:potassium voltage-gated channel subfamily H member 8-like n=1 Tax=Dreissena polymorpha TaxID=45954 RepID=UPI002264A65C|nr:potassium voltage-gated channel subfamily H member 8-like [Dreissena polymorpha]
MKKGLLAPQNTFLDTIATRFDGTHSNFVLGNAQATGCPVVYCSDGFVELTGYQRSQVMGRSCSCKFLFGEETLLKERERIEDALEKKIELKTELLMYKKSGQKFKCLLDVVPITNEKSQVVLILVSHKEIGNTTRADDDSDDEKTSNEADSDEEMAEAYRRCQARQGRSAGTLPGLAGAQNQRRRSRAVLYHLSGQFEKHNRANRAKSKLQQLNKFSSISTKMPEYKVQEVKKSKFILVHYGLFKIGWDWLILLCTFYTAILVPYNAAFTRAEKNQRESIYSDVVVEVLFMFDIIFNFRTSFVNKRGQVVYEARMIAINYVKGWFLLDLLAAIPFDFLYIFNISADAPVHLLKVARLIRLARLLQKIDRFSQYSALVLALLMGMFTLLAHWMACIWYAIGHAEFEEHITSGWLYELSERLDLNKQILGANHTGNDTFDLVKPDLIISYLSALYFTCSSMTSVGFGNVSANTSTEKIFAVCCMIIGALMHAVVFGNVTALIQRMYQRRTTFHSKTKDLKDFFRANDIPKPLKQRMQEYFQTMWSMNNGIETDEILKDFPEEMKGELGLHLHKDILNLPIFEEAPQGCLRSIALHTKRSFCAPGEFLVHKGDTSNYMYLLVSGSMEVLKTDMVVAILGKGDLFGSDIDFEDPISVCNYDVRSLTYSELQCISIKGLNDVLLLYPDFAEKFAKDIHNDLTYNLRQTAEDSDEETNSSPKARVCTLPSISEDDELSASDDDDDHDDKLPPPPPTSLLLSEKPSVSTVLEEEEDGITAVNPSISSPLLPHTPRLSHKMIPNGDIQVEAVGSPSSVRLWGSRRPPGLMNRSFKETRKVRMGVGMHSCDAAEKIVPHIQNLQNEVEGTKASITKLERKVSKISQDIGAIDRNLREILKHITNVGKISHLEPLLPPSPITPLNHSRATFSFDFSEITLNDSPCSRNALRHKSAENIRGSDSSITVSDRSPKPLNHDVFNSTNTNPVLKSRATSRFPQNFDPSKRRSSLQVPLLLNPHDLVTRRYSDGTENKDKPIITSMASSKSDNNVTKQVLPFSETQSEYLIANRSLGGSEEMTIDSVSDSKDTDHLLDKDTFMNSLEDVHSFDCNSPLTERHIKSFDNSVCLEKGNRSQLSNSCDERLNDSPYSNIVHPSAQTIKKKSNDKQRLKKENQTNCSAKRSLVSSKSCFEIGHGRAKPLRPNDCNISKVQSQVFLETEFGANTPNEVKTVFCDKKPLSRKDSSNLCLSNSLCDRPVYVGSIEIIDSSPDYKVDMGQIPLMCHGSNENSLQRDFNTTHFDSQEHLRTDSGNVSLMETQDFKFSSADNVDQYYDGLKDTFGKSVNNISNKYNHIYGNKSRMKENECVSPDTPTDISGSLKTEDDDANICTTVLDIECDNLARNGIFTPMFDDNSLRTTNL